MYGAYIKKKKKKKSYNEMKSLTVSDVRPI